MMKTATAGYGNNTYDWQKPEAQPAPPPPATAGDIINKTLSSVGHTILAPFQQKPATPPPAPTNIVDTIGSAVKSFAQSNPITAIPTKIASSKAGQGVGLGVGTLAVNLLSGIDDPFGHYKTADSEAIGAQERASGKPLKTATGQTTDAVPNGSNLARDLPNDAATGILGRILLAGGAVGKAADSATGALVGKSFVTPAIVNKGANLITHGALGLFGLNVVKDTPAYIQQIAQSTDPTSQFSLATQLLGSYFLLGHGATSIAKGIPTTKTIKGGTETVPVDFNGLREFLNSPNPDITPQQHEAFTNLFNEQATAYGKGTVKAAMKEGTVTIQHPDVTVPNFYGNMINAVREKLVRNQPLSPAEQAVQASVVTSPQTIVPKPSDIIKDPTTLATVTKMQSDAINSTVPVTPATAQLATFKNPSLGIQQAPATAVVPGGAPIAPVTSLAADRPQPTASLSRVSDITQLANHAATPQAFIAAGDSINIDSLRGFKQSDGSIVNGRGSSPQSVSVLDPKTKSIIEQPLATVLTDFYHQARGEQAPTVTQPTQTPAVAPAGSKTLKNVIKTKDQVQAAIDAQQKAANAGISANPQPKTLKRRKQYGDTPAMSQGQGRLDQLALEHANELRALHKATGGVSTTMIEHNGGAGTEFKRHSLNSNFYRDFYKQNKKAPTRQDWLDHAHAQLKAGKGEGLMPGDPKIAEYQKLDAKVNPPVEHKELDVSTIKFKVEDNGKTELTTRVLTALGDRTSINRQFIEKPPQKPRDQESRASAHRESLTGHWQSSHD